MFLQMMKWMLAARGFKVSEHLLWEFLTFLKQVSPWFLEEGSMTIDDWNQVGKDMRRYVQKHGENTMPAQSYPLWLQIREILTETSDFQGLIQETASDSGGQAPPFEEPPTLELVDETKKKI